MTVGELMALMCKYASDEDDLLMVRSISDIEVRGDEATLYFNSSSVTLYKDGHWEDQWRKMQEEKMTVGELIALLCKHSGDEDYLLMAKGIDDIEIRGDHVTLYFTYSKTSAITIYNDGR